jgi:hypothetical protein
MTQGRMVTRAVTDVVDAEARRRYLRDPEARIYGAAALGVVTSSRRLGREPPPKVLALAEEYTAMTGYPSIKRDPLPRPGFLRRLLRRLAG